MNYSDGLKINVNKLNADEMLLVLLEIEHPMVTDTIRLVSDNRDLVSNGENYLAMNFGIERQSDVQNELPMVTLSIPNVGRSLVKWIDSSGGGRDAKITLMITRRSTPNIIEESIVFGIQSVNITTKLISFSLIIQNNLNKRAMRFIYDTKRSPGLF